MVLKEEIAVWFSRQPSHQRLDVLCTLASICLPFELRFLNTCVAEGVRRNTAPARDLEILAALEKNCPQPGEVDLQDENSRRKLILTLSLLHAGNRIVAHSIFKILWEACSDPKTFRQENITPQFYQELSLIFTMILHHPGFTYDEKFNLGEVYRFMQSKLRPLTPPPAHTPEPEQLSQTNGRLPKATTAPAVSGPAAPSTPTPAQSQQVERTSNLHRRNRQSPKATTNGLNGQVQSIMALFKEHMDKEKIQLPKNWTAFEHLSAQELLCMTDQQFLGYGLTSGIVSHLRKFVNQHLLKNSNGVSDDGSNIGGSNSTGGGGKAGTPNKPSAHQRPVKTCMGPPNVQPAFNNAQRNSASTTLARAQSPAPSPITPTLPAAAMLAPTATTTTTPVEEAPISRAGSSSSSSGSSSLPCSPPGSPTDSSTVAHREAAAAAVSVALTATAASENNRKQYPVLQPPMMLNSGTRPQARPPATAPASLRGANSNMSFLRPMGATGNGNVPSRHAPSASGAPGNYRGNSQSRDLHFPVSLSFPLQQQQQQSQQQQIAPPPSTVQSSAVPAAGTNQPASFIVDSSTPPPHLEAQPAQQQPAPTALPMFPYGYLPMNGDGSSFGQHHLSFITTGPPPNSARGPVGPHDIIYSPASYIVHSQIMTQPLPGHHGTSSNGRATIMDMPYFPPGSYILTTRADQQQQQQAGSTDYSRPPPPGTANSTSSSSSGIGSSQSQSSGGPSPVPPPPATLSQPGAISCYNCGGSGHRGPQCQLRSFEEIIRPSPA